VVIQFFDTDGLPIQKQFERKIENAVFQEDFARPDTKHLGSLEHAPSVYRSYMHSLLSCTGTSVLGERTLRVVYGCESPSAMLLMHSLLQQLGCTGMMMNQKDAAMVQTVLNTQSDVGV
jgi:mannose-1-phosphate guanylyltransferase / phosphomannomutase